MGLFIVVLYIVVLRKYIEVLLRNSIYNSFLDILAQFNAIYNPSKYFVWAPRKRLKIIVIHFSRNIPKLFVKHLLGLPISISMNMIIYIYIYL